MLAPASPGEELSLCGAYVKEALTNLICSQVHVSLLRALAEDETRAERAQHALDLALLDAVTWPDYLWDFLRIAHDPSGHLSSALSQPSPQPPQQAPVPPAGQVDLMQTLAKANLCKSPRQILASCYPAVHCNKNFLLMGHLQCLILT